MATIGGGVWFDAPDWHQKRKLLDVSMMLMDDEAPIVLEWKV